jgi:hypothetical protein
MKRGDVMNFDEPKPAFVKDGSPQRFFVRGGNATTALSGASV